MYRLQARDKLDYQVIIKNSLLIIKEYVGYIIIYIALYNVVHISLTNDKLYGLSITIKKALSRSLFISRIPPVSSDMCHSYLVTCVTRI